MHQSTVSICPFIHAFQFRQCQSWVIKSPKNLLGLFFHFKHFRKFRWSGKNATKIITTYFLKGVKNSNVLHYYLEETCNRFLAALHANYRALWWLIATDNDLLLRLSICWWIHSRQKAEQSMPRQIPPPSHWHCCPLLATSLYSSHLFKHSCQFGTYWPSNSIFKNWLSLQTTTVTPNKTDI